MAKLASTRVYGNLVVDNALNIAGQLTSSVATGTAPLIVASTTKVTNLNADKLDDMESATANTVSTIVARDGNGDFAARTLDLTNAKVNNAAGSLGLWTTSFNYLSPTSHNGDTWLRNSVSRWTFQGGADSDDWTKSFQLYLQPVGTAGADDKLMEIGQRQSNTTAGDYKGVKIVHVTGSAVADGYLQAGEIQVDNLNFNTNVISSTNTNGRIDLTPNGSGTVRLTKLASAGFVKTNASGDLSVDQTAYISGITSGMVTTALGFTPYNATNPSGYISGITSGMVTTALGFTPYNSTNPAGYTTNTGTVTSIATSGSVSGITLTGGTITTSGTITLGGSISGLTTSNLSASAGITNGQLANSSITIGSSAVSLGGTLGTIAGLTSLTSATVVATTGLTTGSAGQTWVIDGSGTSLLLQSGATPTTRMTLTDGGVVTATTFVGALTGTASGNLIKSTYPGAWTEATGAITYFGGYGWSTLAPGTNGYVLKMSSGSPVWAAESSAYTLPTATSTVKGGIELFSDTVQATAANSVTSTASRTYGIQLNAAGQGVVNVPWTDKVLTDSNSVAYGFTSSWASTGLTLTLLANKNYKVSFYSNYTKNYSGTLNNIALELLFDSVAGTAPKISGYWYHAVTSAATAFTNSNTLYTAATTNAVGNRFVPAVNSNNVTNAPVGFEANISTGSANRVITLYAQCSGDNTGMTLTADASLTAVEL